MKLLTIASPISLFKRQSQVNQVLMLSCCFSLFLSLFRVMYTGHLLFLFLVWNLFLAFIPYAISDRMCRWQQFDKKKFLMYALTWLLFLPNSFYLITDLFHLGMNEDVPLWYDLALIFSFVWNGLLFGIISIRQMEKLFESHFKMNSELLFVFPLMVMNGFGIYLGRYLRFNSWDVLANPFRLAEEVVVLFIHPIRNRFDWSMITCYSIFLTLIYIALKRLSRVL